MTSKNNHYFCLYFAEKEDSKRIYRMNNLAFLIDLFTDLAAIMVFGKVGALSVG